jgi:hypothetical protein
VEQVEKLPGGGGRRRAGDGGGAEKPEGEEVKELEEME